MSKLFKMKKVFRTKELSNSTNLLGIIIMN